MGTFNPNQPKVRLWIGVFVLALNCGALHGTASAQTAAGEIVSVDGKGEFREPQQSSWRAAKSGQALQPAQFVRTGDASKMAIVFADRTQMRLGPNSMFQIVDAAKNKDQKTTIDLKQGRTWMQTKTPQAGVTVRTPSALAAIRGTDWEMVVDESGSSTLTVFSGEVNLSNEMGAVDVRSNEQATVAVGRAPVKTTIVNPADRIQWVSSFTIDISRYPEARAAAQTSTALAKVSAAIDAGRADEAAALLADLARDKVTDSALVRLLQADCAIYEGDVAKADALLKSGQRAFSTDARFNAVLSSLSLRRGDGAAARAYAVAARAQADGLDAALAEGEAARFLGETAPARSAFVRARSQAATDARGWLGWGQVEAERNNVGLARELFARAQSLSPSASTTQRAAILSEIGTNEMAAGEFTRAQAAFERALALEPGNAVTLTSQAVLLMRQGRNEDALNALLKAGTTEPRYARAHLYSAVAYARLGRVDRALESLARAKALDPNDPVPYQLSAMMRTDDWQPNAALNEAIAATARAPFLRSLNQFADTQRGAANLGATLAAAGLEGWAQHLAQESYLPLWAGSHLFLADRYAGSFAKQSELFQGFLLDPLVFGASNRYQSILATPGFNTTLAARYSHSRDTKLTEPTLTLNGATSAPSPLAYFVEHIDTRVDGNALSPYGTAQTTTAALGVRPAWNAAGFIYVTRLSADIETGKPNVDGAYQRITGNDTRADIAGNFAFDGASQLWLKAGSGRQSSSVDTVNRSTVGVFGGVIAQRESAFSFEPTQRDAQVRFTRQYDQREGFALGAEWARITRPQTLLDDMFTHAPGAATPRRTLVITDSPRTSTIYASGQWQHNAWQIDGYVGRHTLTQTRRFNVSVPPPFNFRSDIPDDINRSQTSIALGTVWRPTDSTTLRFVCSRWQRPATNASLAPVAFAGVVIDDQLLNIGGQTTRCHARIEQTWASNTFVTAAHDHQKIDNLTSVIDGVINSASNIADLDRLRARVAPQAQKFGQLEDLPVFGRADVTRVHLNAEHLLTNGIALRAHYTHADSKNSATGFRDAKVPYLPRHQLYLNASVTLPGRGIVGVGPVYRSIRFIDEVNSPATQLSAGWDVQAKAFIEWDRKHWSLEVFAQNLAKKQSTRILGANLAYRF